MQWPPRENWGCAGGAGPPGASTHPRGEPRLTQWAVHTEQRQQGLGRAAGQTQHNDGRGRDSGTQQGCSNQVTVMAGWRGMGTRGQPAQWRGRPRSSATPQKNAAVNRRARAAAWGRGGGGRAHDTPQTGSKAGSQWRAERACCSGASTAGLTCGHLVIARLVLALALRRFGLGGLGRLGRRCGHRLARLLRAVGVGAGARAG